MFEQNGAPCDAPSGALLPETAPAAAHKPAKVKSRLVDPGSGVDGAAYKPGKSKAAPLFYPDAAEPAAAYKPGKSNAELLAPGEHATGQQPPKLKAAFADPATKAGLKAGKAKPQFAERDPSETAAAHKPAKLKSRLVDPDAGVPGAVYRSAKSKAALVDREAAAAGIGHTPPGERKSALLEGAHAKALDGWQVWRPREGWQVWRSGGASHGASDESAQASEAVKPVMSQ